MGTTAKAHGNSVICLFDWPNATGQGPKRHPLRVSRGEPFPHREKSYHAASNGANVAGRTTTRFPSPTPFPFPNSTSGVGVRMRGCNATQQDEGLSCHCVARQANGPSIPKARISVLAWRNRSNRLNMHFCTARLVQNFELCTILPKSAALVFKIPSYVRWRYGFRQKRDFKTV